MNLAELQEQHIKKLEQNAKVKVVHKECWTFPVHTLQLTYKPVVRTSMDILMKMLLISFQEGKFQHAEQLSDILLVEQLFIQDLMTKMQKTGLIEKVDHVFELTHKGMQQLSSGVYEEEQEPKKVQLLYSPVHEKVLYGDLDEVLDIEDFPETFYRHSEHEDESPIPNDVLLQEIRTLKEDSDDEENETNNQVIISALDEIEQIQVNDVPCIEFIVYDKEKEAFCARVWNTLQNSWDLALEHQLNEKERPLWRERFDVV